MMKVCLGVDDRYCPRRGEVERSLGLMCELESADRNRGGLSTWWEDISQAQASTSSGDAYSDPSHKVGIARQGSPWRAAGRKSEGQNCRGRVG